MSSEWLYALGEGEGEVSKTLTYLREARDREVSEIMRAAEFLLPLTDESPVARLRKETEQLRETMETALQRRGTANIQQVGRAIQRQFGTWLSAFRACDDHTSHQLSQTFGKASPAFNAFKQLKSKEYDRDFAYRLCWQLRNASQHVGDVINALRMDIQASEDDDEGTYTLISQIDPHDLVAKFPGITSKVRAELMACDGNLELILLVRSAVLSWDRIYCGLLQAVWEDIAPMVDLCTAVHEEAVAAGGLWAVFIDARPEDIPDDEWHMRHNPYHHAELVTRNRAGCQRTADRKLPDLPPEAFIRDSGNPPGYPSDERAV